MKRNIEKKFHGGTMKRLQRPIDGGEYFSIFRQNISLLDKLQVEFILLLSSSNAAIEKCFLLYIIRGLRRKICYM
jgi:hypothetical protein